MIAREWITKAGLLAVVVDSNSYYCGYVRLPADHPLVGVGYADQSSKIPDLPEVAKTGKRGMWALLRWSMRGPLEHPAPDAYFDVHGSITFSGKIRDYDGFWYGFDCGHRGDTKERCDLSYCSAECESLAEQLVAFTPAERDSQQPTGA